jgi:hypothetical protein
MTSALDIPAILAEGGEAAIALLQFAIRSGQREPLFYALVTDYRQRCNHQTALALFDLFCAADAPARLSISHVLPPQDLRFSASMPMLRQQRAQMLAPEPPDPEKKLHIAQPQRTLFDGILQAMTPVFEAIGQQYDPAKRVNDCLPGGSMSQGQRHFVTQVWVPRVRPQLVAAGFWRVTTLE